MHYTCGRSEDQAIHYSGTLLSNDAVGMTPHCISHNYSVIAPM